MGRDNQKRNKTDHMTRLVKRSISLHGHRTSVALERPFWDIIDMAAERDGHSKAGFIASLDDERIHEKSRLGLAAYLRVWALNYVIEKSGFNLQRLGSASDS